LTDSKPDDIPLKIEMPGDKPKRTTIATDFIKPLDMSVIKSVKGNMVKPLD
jgi:hypothetical protein